MKKIKLFIFLICSIFLFNNVVFAADDVVVKSVEPVFDETTGVVGSYDDEKFSVVFNDLGQEVSYKILIENTSKKPLYVVDLSVSLAKYGFVGYDFEGIKLNDTLKANEEKEVVLTLKTLEDKGFARNFNEDLVLSLGFSGEQNPDTIDTVLIYLVVMTLSAFFIVLSIKKRIALNIVILVVGVTSLCVVSASSIISIKIPGTVSYKSLNVLKPSGVTYEEGLLNVSQECTYPKYSSNTCDIALSDYSHTVSYENVVDFWEYASSIKNIYIKNVIEEPSNYAYKFDVSDEVKNRVYAYLVDNNGMYDLYLVANGIIYANDDSTGLFAGMTNLEKIDNIEGLDFSEASRMGAMFYDCELLKELDLSSFNTSTSVDMSYMFGNTINLSTLNVSSFDTSKVNDMYGMFAYSGIKSLDLSNFDVTNVLTMSYMFAMMENLTELNLTGFETLSSLDMSFMFYGLKSLNSLDVSSFDTSKVKEMNGMFAGDSDSTDFTKYNLIGIDKFDTSSLESMYGMFAYNGLSKLDLSNFRTPKLTNMQFAFANMPNLECILLTNFDYSNVKYMASFLYNDFAENSLIVDFTSFNPNEFTGEFGLYSIYQSGYDIGIYLGDSSYLEEILMLNQYGDISDLSEYYEECCIWPR